ncbi:MAG: hypothetical protein ACYCWW_14295 [Deltaproteobacteria bacterium]
MGINVKNGPGAFETSIKNVLAGVSQVFPVKSTFTLAGTTMTQPQLLQKLQAMVDEYESIQQARASLQKQILAAKASRTDDHDFLVQLHGVIVALLGHKNPQLQQFGYTPAKPRIQTVEQKAATAAKRAATRKKLNTMGRRQKVKFLKDAAVAPVLLPGEVPSGISPAAEAATTSGSSGATTSGTPAGNTTGNPQGSNGNGQ